MPTERLRAEQEVKHTADGTTDEAYFRMFAKWPCNVFKPRSHIVARYDEMHVVGVGICDGYKGTVKAPKVGEGWTVHLSDGAKWTYLSTAEMLADWRIARTFDEYVDVARAAIARATEGE